MLITVAIAIRYHLFLCSDYQSVGSAGRGWAWTSCDMNLLLLLLFIITIIVRESCMSPQKLESYHSEMLFIPGYGKGPTPDWYRNRKKTGIFIGPLPKYSNHVLIDLTAPCSGVNVLLTGKRAAIGLYETNLLGLSGKNMIDLPCGASAKSQRSRWNITIMPTIGPFSHTWPQA